MITIKNGDAVKRVTNGAFKNFYQHHGWHRISVEDETKDPEQVLTPEDEKIPENEEFAQNETDPEGDPEDDFTEDDLSEIPLGEMDFTQLHTYAGQLGLDHEHLHSKKELRALIRENLK